MLEQSFTLRAILITSSGGSTCGLRTAPPLVVSSTPLKKTLVFHIWVVNTIYYIETIDFRVREKILAGYQRSTFLNFCPIYKYNEDKFNE
jgi:hypothetical protein